MRPSTAGLVVGLVLGLAAAFGGFHAFLLVTVLGGLGLVVGQVVEGRIDLSGYLGGGGRR
jgi:uncharacterized membrane protein